MNEKNNKPGNPHQNHRARVRETFRKAGIDGMPDHNILELLLFYSIPRKDTNELAHKLIETFGSLDRVFDASFEQLMQVDGMGESSALLLSMIPGICRRYVESASCKKINLSDPDDVKKFIVKKYYGVKNEIFYLLCLDGLGNLINCSKISEGIQDMVLIDKRTVLETAFRANADTVIFVHNHPNGIAAPSKKDIEMTGEFKSVLSGVGIRLADHIIVADKDIISLASIRKFSSLFI